MRRPICYGVCLILTARLCGPAAAQTVWYVDDDGAPAAGCTSWADACPELQRALALADAGDSIWVAAGIYRPDYDLGSGQHTQDRAASFQLQSGVKLHGGFAGTESTLQDRAGLFDETILSGDLLQNDAPAFAHNTDNSYHVVTGSGSDPSAILDGFAVAGGHADGAAPDDDGGGLFIAGGSPTVSRCAFLNNAAARGGAVHIAGGSPTFLNCRFASNAASLWGGAVDNAFAMPTFMNCLFTDNTAAGEGGVLHSDLAGATLINCTMGHNDAERGGALFNYAGAIVELTNCILWGNTDGSGSIEAAQLYLNASENQFVVNFSCVQGWTGSFGGIGNHGDDPFFENFEARNLRLTEGSPCVDGGTNEALPRAITFDLDGQPRFVDGDGDDVVVVDMGAYEFQGAGACAADLSGDGQIDAADLAILLGSWGSCPPQAECPADLNGSGTVDAADLAQLLGAWGPCW